MFKINSSAIDVISDVQNDQVKITFNGGREYTYQVSDSANFVESLTMTIEKEQSVGSFVNQQIRNSNLTLV
jgi:hypothetical protein